ncbi:DUF4249 domain-containing protein [Flavobacteriaceae bacterium TP-CH-4]|uniref:DUF4249 domain-containing protein n=1 Tax=Pelagihabitans pacificus TaxID=2696054 RepID=A0A967AT04_9FLAO|nr:DUF4249 domain-containing protein [Pelagihabitans pacificus]NHF59826.1 DUF4249 domain-containing protein [Pelagihabitans pacificus]
MRKYVLFILIGICCQNCIEPFNDIPREVSESGLAGTLVVETTLTNELKRQQVVLSRPADLGFVNPPDSVINPVAVLSPIKPPVDYERNAAVTVSDDQGNDYLFEEDAPGIYQSQTAFAAQEGISYTLSIETDDGVRYSSTPESFQGLATIDSVYAVREQNDFGEEGVFIFLDGNSPDTNANYYRYTYEETFKIIAPEWRVQDFELTNYDPCALPVITFDLEIIFRDNGEGRVCYRTDASNTIIQNSTLGLQENTIQRFPVRFLSRNNYIISHRYSVLVRQYLQSQGAYDYYRTLESFSSSEDIFSTVQPGFLEGNIQSVDGEENRVIGYFEVAPVTEKRVYFNYDDLFPGEALPEYPVSCNPTAPPLDHVSYCFTGLTTNSCPFSIVESVNLNLISYYDLNTDGIGVCPGPYLVTNRACGDCTVLGDTPVPVFWEEE